MKTEIRVYTSITGGFELERKDIPVLAGCDIFKSERRNAKIYKAMPHLYFDNDFTIWLDGNIAFAYGIDLYAFVDDFLGHADIGVFRHPYRSDIYSEARACIANDLDDSMTLITQLLNYQDHFASNWLAECGVIVRRNNDKVRRFNESWWAQICRFSSRDQISFPFVAAMHPDVFIRLNPGNVREDNRFIYLKRQSSKR